MDFFRAFMRTRMAPIGFLVILVMIIVASAAPLIAPHDPLAQDYFNVLSPPSDVYPLGTDDVGRDILSRIIYGTRVSLQVGVIAVGIAVSIGATMGLAAGHFGGRIDDVLMRLCDTMLAFPGLILTLFIASMLGPGIGNAMIAIGIVSVPMYARLIRGQVLSVREREYILAVRALGASTGRIIIRHIMPNVIAPLVVQMSLGVAVAIITEANLSFLGLGVRPPTPSWGSMIRSGYAFLEFAPWYSIFPGIAIFVSILAFNFLGDGLRMVLDPRLMGRRQS